MKLTYFSVFRFFCTLGVLFLLNKNGLNYNDIDYWLILLIMLAFGLSEFAEQTIKRYQ